MSGRYRIPRWKIARTHAQSFTAAEAEEIQALYAEFSVKVHRIKQEVEKECERHESKLQEILSKHDMTIACGYPQEFFNNILSYNRALNHVVQHNAKMKQIVETTDDKTAEAVLRILTTA
jgi:hypothetical protein